MGDYQIQGPVVIQIADGPAASRMRDAEVGPSPIGDLDETFAPFVTEELSRLMVGAL